MIKNPYHTDLLAADIRAEADAQEQQRLLEAKQLADVKDTFSTPHGRRVLRFLLWSTGLWEDPTDRTNAATNAAIGRQNFGRELEALIAVADRETYLHVCSERADELLGRSEEGE